MLAWRSLWSLEIYTKPFSMLPLSLVPTLLVLALWCCRARLGLAVLAVVPPCPPCLPCSLLLVVVAVLAMLALLLSFAVLIEDTHHLFDEMPSREGVHAEESFSSSERCTQSELEGWPHCRRRPSPPHATAPPSTGLPPPSAHGLLRNCFHLDVMAKLRDWADLPDGQLHSIVELLPTFHDLLAFAATCHPWRSAFSSYPSKSTLYALIPPLLLDPNVSFCSSRHFPNAKNTSVPKRPCYVTDLASQDTILCSQIPLLSVDYGNNRPPSALHKFAFRGASFGHMIFSSNKICFLFDVFTGIEVSPPLLPADEYSEIRCGATLTGPLASPNSHLIVCTLSFNFFWRVGSDSWSKCSPRNGSLTEFVVFKGQVFGMGSDRSLFMVHLSPQIHLQEIPVSWGGRNSMTKWHLCNPWLVVCDDMLLMVGCQSEFPGITQDVFEAYRIDTSTDPAKWVKVERLENWAIFISSDRRVQPLSCLNLERCGGRSNCVYCYDYEFGHLVAFEVGKPLPEDDATRSDVFIFACVGSMVQPIWIVPSMLSLCCDGQ